VQLLGSVPGAGVTATALDLSVYQVPRLRVAPAWSVRPPAAVEAIEQAAAYGLQLDPWQELGLCDAMVERADGTWAVTEVDLVVSRQNGKNGAVRARQLYGLYTIGSRAMHTAHEFKTAREHFDKMLAWIEAYDDLRREVKKVRTSHGEEGIVLHSGAELRFVARSKGSGRGFDPDDLYYDGALILTKTTLSASMMAQSASPNPQRWFFSSAGTKASEVLGRHRQRALDVLAGKRPGGRFVYHEYSPDFDGLTEAEKHAARRDPAVRAQANPGYPHRVTDETIEDELDSIGDGPDFDRERFSLGDWPVDAAALQWAVISEAQWSARSGAPRRTSAPAEVAYAVAGSWPNAERCSLARSWREDDGVRVVELVDRRRGSAWLVEELKALAAADPPPLGVVMAAGGTAAAQLAGPLKEAGLDVLYATVREEAQAAGQLVAGAGAVPGEAADTCHYGQAPLDTAVGGASRHHVGDVWRWDRDATSDPVEAAGLARWLHVEKSGGRLPVIY
jgi:hypothetical protein